MSSPSSPIMIPSDDEIVPESPLVTIPRSPKFMPILADRTAEIECSKEFDSSEDEPETCKEKTKTSEAKSPPTATLPTPTETGDEVAALRLRLGQDEQRIAELEQQIAIMKDGKRKWEENSEGSSGQQQGKRQKTVNVYAAGPNVKKKYKGKQPQCTRCNQHHTGQCGPQCGKCGRVGHLTKDCRTKNSVNQPTPANNQAANNPSNQMNPKACFECGGIGHFKNQCGNLRNRNINNANNNNVNNANANNQEAPRACYECGGVGHLKAQCGNLRNQNKNKKNSTRSTNE